VGGLDATYVTGPRPTWTWSLPAPTARARNSTRSTVASASTRPRPLMLLPMQAGCRRDRPVGTSGSLRAAAAVCTGRIGRPVSPVPVPWPPPTPLNSRGRLSAFRSNARTSIDVKADDKSSTTDRIDADEAAVHYQVSDSWAASVGARYDDRHNAVANASTLLSQNGARTDAVVRLVTSRLLR